MLLNVLTLLLTILDISLIPCSLYVFKLVSNSLIPLSNLLIPVYNSFSDDTVLFSIVSFTAFETFLETISYTIVAVFLAVSTDVLT